MEPGRQGDRREGGLSEASAESGSGFKGARTR